MDFVPLLVLSTTVKKVVDLVKYLSNTDWNAVVTQLVAWAAGIAISLIAAHSDVAVSLTVGGHTLADLNAWAQAVLGVGAASAASVGWDVIKSVDNTDSAAVGALLRRPSANPPPSG